ncbi:hypothetical protein MalM25_05450 [Planctomycetes bacterium MalM25]|nr:hypothetical protein MalM25_05450 [Planctomycetes bacterium MalM25]
MLRDCCCLLGMALALVLNSGVRASDQAEIERRYHEAIEASLGSESADHESLMRAIVADAPDYEPARAELGEVRIDGRWLPVDYAQHLASEDPRLEAYHELSEKADPERGSLRLARWCEKQGLDYEARAHWLNVLQERPKHPEALKRLNAGWRDGELWDLTLAAQASERARELQRSANAWEKRFRQLEARHTVREEVLAVLSTELDAGAIEPIERRVERLAAEPGAAAAERSRQLIGAWFDAVDRLDEVEVTASLCRTAILGDEAIRSEATELLKSRPEFDTMPLLLSALIAPIESKATITRDAQGSLTYEHRLLHRDREVHSDHRRHWTAAVNQLPSNDRLVTQADWAAARARVMYDTRMSTILPELEFRLESQKLEEQVAAHNKTSEEMNSRVLPVLRAISGLDAGEDPVAWWKHWQEHSGYDRYAPQYDRSYDFDTIDYYVEAPPERRCECFIAGTPVWTRTGKTAIEDLEPGDLVLARDPHVGGLVYRSVIDTTVREPSPTVQLTAGGETIVATIGHPFWVIGAGWTMAKDLAAGDVLSTVKGPLELDHVENHADRTAHNLVVEGAANYYVGEAGVLVHDNTPRQPAVGLTASR